MIAVFPERQEPLASAGPLAALTRPLHVHVCIDQPRSDEALSGLVRSWAKFLEAAIDDPAVDVTAHVVGERDAIEPLAVNVRWQTHRLVSIQPLLGWFGVRAPTRVGLWPYHRGLAAALRAADLIHTTYTGLTFAMTGLWVARARRIPLVHSVHTDVPRQGEIYAQRIARTAFGRTPYCRPLVERRHFARLVRRLLERQTRWYLARCDRVLLSKPTDDVAIPAGYPAARLGFLGRGIDRACFHPHRRDRQWLAERYGIGPKERLIVSVGRLAPEKNVETLVGALAMMRAHGVPFRVLFCGVGDERTRIEAEIGERAVLAGLVSHDELGRLYAASDLFTLASKTEIYANVVVEAMSSGLAAVVSREGGAKQHVIDGVTGRILQDDTPEAWAETLTGLLDDHATRTAMGRAARGRVEHHYADWPALFRTCLRPLWLEAAAAACEPKPVCA